MGANKNCDRQKCGEILINIRTIRNKAKVFTFHCALCSIDCDQLKKFSKHLEKHLHLFDNDLKTDFDKDKIPNVLFESEEIKVEEQFNDKLIDKSDCKSLSERITSEVYEDPLETNNPQRKDLDCDGDFMSRNIKTEKENEEKINEVESDSRNKSLDCNIKEGDHNDEDSKNNIQTLFILNDVSSDDCSNYSSDANIKSKVKTSRSAKRSKDVIIKKESVNTIATKQSTRKTIENGSNDDSKPKRRRRLVIETILPFLIQQYKKYKILWQVDDISFGIKNKKYEIYDRIAETLKLEENTVISLEDIRYHINYLNELYSKDKEEELRCKVEKKVFSPKYEHYAEMSFLSESQGPFLCEFCNEILPRYEPYCQHMAQHNDTQPFKCPSCDMMFTSYHKYLIHKKRHLGILNFHCDVCGKGYLFKNDLEWHVTSHTGDKPYLCQICGRGFRARHGYDNHVRRHEERYRHECHICKKGFNQLYALNNHIKSHLNIRDVICKICGKGFVHTKYLKRHELIHGTEKHYKCNECGKAFFQACGLRSHRKNHHSLGNISKM